MNFFLQLHGLVIDGEWEDKMVWMYLDINKFSVKQFYAILEPRVVVSFPAWVVWNSWALFKVNFFAWEVSWAKILTLNWL